MRLLLISNSTNFGENYLAWATTQIELFCAQNHINKDSRIIFVPFAGVKASISAAWSIPRATTPTSRR